MSLRRIAAAIALASSLTPAGASADPGYLPPFLDRTPALGDRWIYAAHPFVGSDVGTVTVEVVERQETPDGSRYLVEHQLAFTAPNAEVQPVLRNEWFQRSDGSVWRGDLWVDGELSVDLPKPLLVIRTLPLSVLDRHRFGHLGWPKPIKRRGWISRGLSGGVLLGSRLLYPVRMRLADRTHPTLSAEYDATLGRFGWTDRAGLHRTLVSAVIDGVEYEL
jgi:hypothetical protein